MRKRYTIYYPIGDYLNFLKANQRENFCQLTYSRIDQAVKAADFLIDKGFIHVDVWKSLDNGRERLVYSSIKRSR